MKIVHWNIHGWADADGQDNVDQVVQFLAAEDPDVVSLVEVDEVWDHPLRLRRVADELRLNWVFTPAFEYRQAGGFGNALLTREPLHEVHQRQLLPPSLYDGTEPSEPRAVVLGSVPLADRKLTVGSTHFPRNLDSSRELASRNLLGLLSEADQPFVICGDFNQPSCAWLDSDLQTAPDHPTATYPIVDPLECIDYCLVSGVTVRSARVPRVAGSDHLPVIVELHQ